MAAIAQDFSVVIYEREYLLGFDLAQQLELAGIKVVALFNDLEPLLAEIASATKSFHAAILDIYRHEAQVLELAQSLDRQGVLVLLTGTANEANLPAGFEQFQYFPQPTTFDQVLGALHDALVRRSDKDND